MACIKRVLTRVTLFFVPWVAAALTLRPYLYLPWGKKYGSLVVLFCAVREFVVVSQIRAYLQPIADWFASLGTPEPIVHWGHPLMMGIVVFVMGSYTAWAGWQGRVGEDVEKKAENRHTHKRLALWMFTFIVLGYTGGVLSLVMQGQPIFESYHFWTGGLVIGLLGLNGAISFTKFGGGKAFLRTTHAYLGTATLAIMFIHAFLGLKLGLAI